MSDPNGTVLMVICTCGHEFPSELSRWSRWYIHGEDWLEKCPACGATYAAHLGVRRLGAGEAKARVTRDRP